MSAGIVWAQNVGKEHLELVGGKGANLGEMLQIGLPVPPAFVVSAPAYRAFLDETGAGEKIFAILRAANVDEHKSLHEASEKARAIVMESEMPKALAAEILASYASMMKSESGGKAGAKQPLVAVRSSATAEDLPEASFAGQQDTYLNIRGDESLLSHVCKCWASLYTPRAIFYRAKHNFEHDKVAIAVVVQRMVDATSAGVMFTKHPTTGDDVTIIEASWGLGEGVVSGSVSPDHFVLDSTGALATSHISDKATMHVRGKNDQTVIEPVPKEKRTARTLSDPQLKKLFGLARAVEKHYGTPQDIEWAFDGPDLWVLQARPVTTIKKAGAGPSRPDGGKQKGPVTVLVNGLGSSPGVAAGKVAHVTNIDELDKCKDGDILLTPMTTPDMVPAMRRAAAIVTDEGGMTCHAAIVSRELGVPCIVGTKNATKVLKDGQVVTVDGDRGTVVEGDHAPKKDESESRAGGADIVVAQKPLTATQVKVNISMPEAIDRAMRTDPDGVGLLRVEHIVLGLGKHPLSFIRGGREEEYVDYLVDAIKTVADPMYPRSVWVRTLDAPTDEFRAMQGGEDEPHEPNPMLGWRGIRRSLDQPDLVKAEFKAIKKLHDQGFTNVGVMLPLVQHPEEIRRAKALMREVGLEAHKDVEFGIMIEIPAAAIIVDELIDEGLDFVSFGTNDLTQYTLAVDRNNEHVAPLYTEFHPAIGKLIENVIKVARARGVQTSICGQAGSNPKFVEKLIGWGITSVSANIDALPRVREMIARTERKMILDSARRQE